MACKDYNSKDFLYSKKKMDFIMSLSHLVTQREILKVEKVR